MERFTLISMELKQDNELTMLESTLKELKKERFDSLLKRKPIDYIIFMDEFYCGRCCSNDKVAKLNIYFSCMECGTQSSFRDNT